MNEQLANALGVVLAAFLTALTAALVPLATRAGKYLASLADLKLTEKQEQQIRWAVETGVAAAEEQGRKWLASQVPDKGAAKLELATKVAKSLAPKAFAELDEQQVEDVVHAGVARLRPSLAPPPPSSSQAPPVPVVIRGSLPDPSLLDGAEPLARPPRVPSDVGVEPLDDVEKTPSERPSAKRGSA